MSDEISPRDIRQILTDLFNETELRTLCFDMGIDYESMPGQSKADKARELVAHCQRHARYDELVNACRSMRPHAFQTGMTLEQGAVERDIPSATKRAATRTTHIFISYKRHVEPDEPLALLLRTALEQAGHTVFMDQMMTLGTDWKNELEYQIDSSDYMLVLLSEAAIHSEMLAEEVAHAHRQFQRTGKARLLPVRVNYTDPLPYQLRHYLNPLHYAEWYEDADTPLLIQHLLRALTSSQSLPVAPGTQGRADRPVSGVSLPRPYADPGFLQSVPAPGGAIESDSLLYIERACDATLRRELSKADRTIITIRAPRQTGKSSLLIRGAEYAQEQGNQVAFLDLQPIEDAYLDTLDTFFFYFATAIADMLGVDPDVLDQVWQGSRPASLKFTAFMEKHVLTQTDDRLVLAIDEADRLLNTAFRNNFYGSIRAWYNKGARDKRWKKLDIVMVISTEPHLLIDDVHQSPFNVGTKINLDDFDADQVHELSQRYRLSLDHTTLAELIDLFNGQPYLTSKALYTLVRQELSWEQLRQEASTDTGMFGDHLRRYLWLLRDKPELRAALKQIIQQHHCADDVAFYRLSRAGLVKGTSSSACQCRCQLYELYLKDRL